MVKRNERNGRAGRMAACLVAACMAALSVSNPAPLRRWAEAAQDEAALLASPAGPASSCVIAAVDAGSRRVIGSWPWPDETVARLVGRISRGNPRAIGIVPCPVSAGGGSMLAEAVRRAGNVAAGYGLAFGPRPATEGPPPPEGSRIRYVTNPWGKARAPRVPAAAGTRCLDAAVAEAAAASGFSPFPSAAGPDGSAARALSLVVAAGDSYLMSLPVAVASVAMQTDRVTLRLKGESVEGVGLNGRLIPTDARGMIRLRPGAYAGPPVVPASGILLDDSPGLWEGKIVLVGETEATPPRLSRGRLPAGAPPILLCAETIDALISGDCLRRSRLSALSEILLAAIFPFAARRLFSRPGWAWLKAGLFAAALCACAGASVAALLIWGEEFGPFYPALSAVVSWALYAGWAACRSSGPGPAARAAA